MLTADRLAANRRNAQKSTGPRTTAGKLGAAQNARRHGLATPIAADPAFNPRTSRLAALLAQGGEPGPVEPLALALVELQRLRETRAHIIVEVRADLEPSPMTGHYRDTLVYLAALDRLSALDRYEARIWASLRRELEAYDLLPVIAAERTQAAEQTQGQPLR